MSLGKMLDAKKNKGRLQPYLRNPNVRWFEVDLEDVRLMRFEDREDERYGLRAGDVVVCEGGEAGRAAVWDGRIQNMKFQKAIHRVRCGPRLSNRFLVHRLMNDYFNGRLADHYTGATIKHLTGQDLSRYRFPLPPLAEQQRIAAILDKADALRAMRRAAIAKLDALAESIFLDMFGDPASNPKGWPTMSVKEALTIPLRNGLSPSKAGRISAEVLTLSAITGARFDDSARKVSTFQTSPPAEQAVNSSDFLICRGNGNVRLVGRGQFPTRSMPGVTFPDTMIAARVSDQQINPAFLTHVWNSNAVRHQIESLARTTNGTFKINQTMLDEIAFICPPLRLQRQFSDRIASVAEIGRRGSGALVELDALFASLQHRAFRGEL